MDVAALGLKVDSTQVEKANDSLDKLATTGAKAEQSAQRLGSTFSKSAREIEQQVARVVTAQQQMVQQQQRTNQLLEDYAKSTQRSSQGSDAAKSAADRFIASLQKQADTLGMTRTQLLAYEAAQLGVADKAGPLLAKLQAAEKQLSATGMSAKQTAAALRGIPAQMTDVVTSLASGQAPLTVLMQQGGQVKDMFGGVGAAARAVGGYVAGLVNPFTVAAAAVGVLTLAAHLGAQETKAYNEAIVTSGNAAGATTGQLQVMARSISQTVGTTGQAADVLTMMVAAGKIPNENLEQYATLANRLDRVGVAAKDTVADLAALGKDPVAASLKLNDALNYLTPATYRQIKALDDLGKAQDAADLAQKAYADAQEQRVPRLEAQLGLLERSWLKIKEAIKGTGDALLGIGRADMIADLQAKIAVIQGNALGRARGGNVTLSASEQAEVQALQEQIAAQRELEKFNRQAAGYQQQQAEATRATVDFGKMREKSLSRQERLQKEITRAQELGAQAGASEAEIGKVIAGLSSEVTKLGIEAQIERLQSVAQIVDVRTKAAIAELQSLRAVGAVNDRGVIEKSADLDIAGMERRRALLEQAIALKAKERDSEKDVAALRGQVDVLEEQIAARRKQRSSDLTVYDHQREAAIYAVIRAEQEQFRSEQDLERVAADKRFNQAQLQVMAYAQSIKDANEQIDFEVSLFGKSADEQARLNEQRRIALGLQEQKRQIDEKARGGNLTAAQVMELNERAEEVAAEAMSRIDTKLYVDKWKHANQEVGESLYEALTGHGKSAADRLKRLFEEMVLKPTIITQLQPVSGAAANIFAGGNGGMSGPSLGSGVPPNPYYSGGGGTLGPLGNYITGGTSLSNFAGTTYANATNTGLDGFLSKNGAFGTAGEGALGAVSSAIPYVGAAYAASQGQYGQAAGMAIGTMIMPGIGTIIGAVIGSLIDGMSKGGGPKAEGYYNPYNDAKYFSNPSDAANDASKKAAQTIQGQYDTLVTGFGGTKGLKFGAGFSTDPQGDAPTMVNIGAGQNGASAFEIYRDNIGRDEKDLQQAIADMGSQAVLKGLQQSHIDGIIGDYLASLGDAATLAADKVTEALARLQKAATEKANLDETWYQLTHTAAENVAHQRQKELDALDISNRSLQVRIYALQDEITAQQQAKEVYAQVAGQLAQIKTNYGAYVDKLNGTPAGLLSPEMQLTNAQGQFDRQLALAKGGNVDALQSLTDYADRLIQAQIGYTASGPQTQATIAAVKAALSQLPDQIKPEQVVANAVQDGTFLLNATLNDLIARADANSAVQVAAINGDAAAQNAAEAAQTAIRTAQVSAAAAQAQQATQSLQSAPSMGFTEIAAGGGVYSNSVVSGTTSFLTAQGKLGVMGEAGPEAIMPLVNVGGSLGVRAIGGFDDTAIVRAIAGMEARVSAMLERLLAVAAAGAQRQIATLGEIADNTADGAAATTKLGRRERVVLA